jgi:dihydrofolate reductase
MLKAVFACDDNWGIGKNGDLPWPHNSEDLKWFKSMTDGKTVIMGRKTWESLPIKPLPNRRNIVVSRNNIEGVETLSHLKFLDFVENSKNEVCLIGGSKLFDSCVHLIDELWLSRIEGDFNCDTFLPRAKIVGLLNLKNVIEENGLKIQRWE